MKAHPAEVMLITASISPEGIPLTTFQLRYWRGIHSELMTHRVFSRNAGSSRARPSKAIIEQVYHDPWGPLHWGKNEPGMQANEELDDETKEQALIRWQSAARSASVEAQQLLQLGAHKQVVNRLLEPFTYIDVVLTATDFNNWFALRDHKDADPTIRDLAAQMHEEFDACKRQLLQPSEWHLPYIRPQDVVSARNHLKYQRITRDEPREEEIGALLLQMSAARCARISYRAFDGTESPIEKDIELFQKLLVNTPLHASPAEHQATPDTRSYCEHVHFTESDDEKDMSCDKWDNQHQHGNFRGWRQFRKMLPNEWVPG